MTITPDRDGAPSTGYTTGALSQLADLLDQDDVYDLVAGAIADARDRKPRAKGDAETGDVLDHVIDVVRAEANSH